MKKSWTKIHLWQKEFVPLFCDQGVTIISVLTALFMTITTIVLAITSVFGGGGGGSASRPQDEGALKKQLNKLADALKRPAGKAVEALLALV